MGLDGKPIHLLLGTPQAKVASHFGVDAERRKRHGHSAGIVKSLAVELAWRLTGATQREIGERFGSITSAAVSTRAELSPAPGYFFCVFARIRQQLLTIRVPTDGEMLIPA